MNISIIIPNYNGKQLLERNLPDVLAALNAYLGKNQQGEIIIVDDASTDDSVEFVNEFKKKNTSKNLEIVLIVSEKNERFAKAVNKGVAHVRYEIVVLLNSDVSPEKGFLGSLLTHFKDEKMFAVGCMDKSVENGKVVLRGRGIGKWEKGFLLHNRGEINSSATLWINGGSGAFRKSIWDKLGGMDTLYAPFYWEDIDLSYRALKSGYTIYFEQKSVVEHRHQEGSIKKHFSDRYVKTISYRNQLIFVWKNITDFNWQIQHILWLPYHLFIALVRFDWYFLTGFFQAFFLLPKIIQSSFKAQKYFLRRDKEILEQFRE